MGTKRTWAKVVFGLALGLVATDILLLYAHVPAQNFVHEGWIVHMLPSVLLFASIWALFTPSGRSMLKTNAASSFTPESTRASIKHLGFTALGSLGMAVGLFILALIFVLFSSGSQAATWLGENFLLVFAVMLLISTPIVYQELNGNR